ncbi:MAG: cupin domain-containing protein [Deltaproteobacteria bacterium]|nr:cupin domain-containing protein [Deltaproteobacteria bacterium]MBW2016662.1 cupin domain-containing protein [Deltaproteobacteria bacterium]MBW2129149.1 cupin domain-containing protein [Deltaproteobacteria bacterium]MBW2302421.1 cupin domain-containing protein [Deltaproteobacteria bacterium]
MNQVEQISRELEKTIARKVRELRSAKNWSLDKLASLTGLSKSYLSQIENCEKTPTISTLTKIAYSLKVNVQTLMGEETTTPKPVKLSIIKPSQRRTIIRNGTPMGYEYESLTHKKTDRIMDGYLLTAGFDLPEEPFVHEGQELVFMLEGTQEFIYDGQSHIVSAGDCLYFDSDRPHMSRSIGDRPARFLVVFCNPRNF